MSNGEVPEIRARGLSHAFPPVAAAFLRSARSGHAPSARAMAPRGMRVCTVAMALVVVHALQLPGSCRSSTSAAQRGAVGMALSDGVLNVGETARDVMHMRCTCDAHAMHM